MEANKPRQKRRYPVKSRIPARFRRKKKSSKKLKPVWKIIIAAVLLYLFWYFNTYVITITEYTIKTPKVSSPVKIAVISDLHADNRGIDADDVIGNVEDTEPDAVMILGDMYTLYSPQELVQVTVDICSALVSDGIPVYFVPGEHDNSQDFFSSLSAVGVHVMIYGDETVYLNGNPIRILGIDNVFFSDTFDLHNAYNLNPYVFTVLMAHIPNYNAYSEFGADLTVCGDTHGGIIQMPFGMGAAYDTDRRMWFPELRSEERVFDKGSFKYDGGRMIITSGLGAYPYPIRFNNRPEVALIQIEPQSEN